MKCIKKLVRALCYGDVEDKFYKNNRETLDSTNYYAVLVLYVVTTFLEMFLYTASLGSTFIGKYRVVFLAVAVIAAVGMIVVIIYIKKHLRYVRVAYYIIAITLFINATIMGVINEPSMPAVTFFVLLIVIPILLVDKPIYSIIFATMSTVVFDCIVLIYKRNFPDTLTVDLMNSIIVLGIEIVFIWYVRNLHLSNLQAKIKFKSQSELDALTGAYNKKHAENLCEKYLTRKESENCGLLILDLDDFKSINDTYGHHRGDEVLRLVGETLLNIFDREDVVGRIGGDEFIVLIKDKSRNEISKKANMLLEGIKQIAVQTKVESVSCSIGICTNEGTNITYQEMFIRADKTLYLAKKKGKGMAAYYCGSK